MRRHVLAAAVALVAVACTGAAGRQGARDAEGSAAAAETPRSAPSAAPASGPFVRLACSLPRAYVERIRAGYLPGRSGQIQIVPRRPNFIGAWLSHSGPWPYVQRVPLFLYGPGHVPEGVTVRRPVTLADLAPTLAEHLGFEFDAPDGTPLREAVLPGAPPPRLILVVVWDAAGRNVLAEHPDAWPTLRRLMPRGTWFERATVGSSPSVTPAIHANIGTGAFPSHHGLVDLRFLVSGELLASRHVGPRQLLVPTLADLYDRAMGNRPVMGLVASGGTLGMLGQGALAEGGDRDVVVAELRGTFKPQINEDLYRFPAYVLDVPGPEAEAEALDLEDGRADGLWMGERTFEDRDQIAHTPAFPPYQTRVLREVIRGEGFGADAVADILFTNYKLVDNVSHRWSMNSPQMEAAVRASDEALGDLVALLDEEVGRGEWVIALTADHGATPRPDVTGAFVIDKDELARDLQAAFDGDGDGRDVVQDVRVTQIWLDLGELAENGFRLTQVARFVAGYTKAQNVADPATLAPGERDDRVFAAAFPGAVLEQDLPCLDGAGTG